MGRNGVTPVILADGSGRRITGIPGDFPNCLAQFGGKPVLTHICEKLFEIQEVEEIVVSTSKRYESLIRRWASDLTSRRIRVVTESSHSEDQKPGVLKATKMLLPRLNGGGILLIAGDNLFTSSLVGMFELYRRVNATVLGVYRVRRAELVKQYSCIFLDARDNEVKGLLEKPPVAFTSIVGTGIYMFPRSVMKQLKTYLHAGGNPDSPGHFISWLIGRGSIFGYKLEGLWWDIGLPETFNEAKRHFGNLTREISGVKAIEVPKREVEVG